MTRSLSPKVICTESFISKSKLIHGDVYDYGKVQYLDSNTKVTIICKIHGEFNQLPGSHTKGRGCPKCGVAKNADLNIGRRHQDIILKFVEVHGFKYDYSEVEYKSLSDKVIIICKEHGKFEQTPRSHIYSKNGCPKCAVVARAMAISNSINDIRDKASIKHGDKYQYHERIGDIVDAECHKHGKFSISSKSLLNGRGCPKCAIDSIKDKLSLPFDEFIKRANALYDNKYEYIYNSYNNSKNDVIVKCHEHGIFSVNVQSHLAGSKCPKCKMNLFESSVARHLDDLDIRYSLYDRTVLDGSELDIYIKDHNLAIECHGTYWHSHDSYDIKEKYKHYHKATQCSNNKIRLLQIFEHEWISKRGIIESIIKSAVGINDRIHARKCSIKTIDAKHLRPFINSYHVQGFKPSTVNYCLIYNDAIVASLTMNKHTKYGWEMGRFVTIPGTTVIGGLSKVFSKFVKDYNPETVVSFADRRFFDGKSYINAGFILDGITSPNYKYVKGKLILSRQRFQKHKLANELEVFDPFKTEHQNMFDNGYRILWDAGNYRYIWKRK